ncbi:hypothetical protein [Pseudomonas sp. EMN2]|uniref:hypothetical protein n=1 Tax=Pseudomonas sp. EMN2 TaxID=2615212 RepID=UPI0015B66E0B|nr:hypothetical protein [Pseudomonas sp. EMN2]
MAHFWDVYQGDKWIDEVTASSPGQEVEEVFLKHGLVSKDGMKAVEFNPDANDWNVHWTPYRNPEKPDRYVSAVIRLVESVETSDDPENFHSGPDYDVYEITVETGPERAFLMWFEQENEYDLCRVGDTSQFLDMGGPNTPVDGEVIDFTFEEFFPLWLDASVRVAHAEINSMSRDAIASMALS